MSRAEREPAGPARRSSPTETVSVTCSVDNRAHDVPCTEFGATVARSDGYYQAVCGHWLVAAPLVAPEGEPCQLCVAIKERKPRRRRARSLHRIRR